MRVAIGVVLETSGLKWGSSGVRPGQLPSGRGGDTLGWGITGLKRGRPDVRLEVQLSSREEEALLNMVGCRRDGWCY